MSGTVHTSIPDRDGHFQEAAFARRLDEISDSKTHLWFDLDYLPGASDIDAILVHEEIGCFNIEVKGIPLEAIESYGLDTCVITGRKDQHPARQATHAMFGLSQYLGSMSSTRPPFFFATVAFPRIKRTDMARRFQSKPLERQFDSMLFAEDVESQSLLWKRLLQIRSVPLHGRAPQNAQPSQRQIKDLIANLDPGEIPDVGAPDRQRERLLVQEVGAPGRPPTPSKTSDPYLEPGKRKPVIFRGAPGTGKTVHLQKIAVAHARNGRSVLFTCYNKVLASMLRTIMSSERLGEEVTNRVIVTHVDELKKLRSEDGLDRFAGLFGTICVDEAQDLADESFEFLQILAADEAEWFMADGPGQELYNDHRASEHLASLRKSDDTTIVRLNRNFRNKSAGFLVAQSVLEIGPDQSQISDWAAKRPLSSADDEQQTLELDLPTIPAGGELPTITRINLPAEGSDWKSVKLREYVAIFYRSLELLAQEGRRRDLAILCAATDNKSSEPEYARQALATLGVPCHDQIDPMNRAKRVPPDHVRLTTIHSSRGIEASRVIVLGMDTGISPREDHGANSRIMCYIALTRAELGTTVVTLSGNTNPFVEFVEAVARVYQEMDGPADVPA